jgi:Fe-S cluster assembly protein SufD
METVVKSNKETSLGGLQNAGPGALSRLFPVRIESAGALLASTDFPTSRQESWKYTRTGRIASGTWEYGNPDAPVNPAAFEISGLNAVTAIVVNGFYRPDLSSRDNASGVSLTPLSQVTETALWASETHLDFFSFLHDTHCTDGLLISIPPNVRATQPIHIIHIQRGSGVLSQPHFFIDVAEGAEAEIIFSFVTSDGKKAFCNAVIESRVGDNARLDVTGIEAEGEENSLILREFFEVGASARLNVHTHPVSGGWVRNDLHIRLNGSGAEANLNGTYLPKSNRFIDNHTLVDHRVPHCVSNELYKGIISGQGKAVFNGKIFVRPDAQKTIAFQTNANMLMDDEASVYSKPELEIYADDVKCSHGSTTGTLNDAALFYLRSRGISEVNARRMLATAFISEVFDRMSNGVVKNYIMQKLADEDLILPYQS